MRIVLGSSGLGSYPRQGPQIWLTVEQAVVCRDSIFFFGGYTKKEHVCRV